MNDPAFPPEPESALWRRLLLPPTTPARDETAAWRRLLALCPGKSKTEPSPQPAPVASEPNHQTEPARHPPLVPPARVVSLRTVDPDKEKTSTFFRSLTWARHDPTAPTAPVSEEPFEQPVTLLTARRFFAYELPWEQRGGDASPPVRSDVIKPMGSSRDLPALAALATRQALDTARAHRSRAGSSRTALSGDGPETRGFFATLPWSGRQNPQQPESLTLPS